MTSKVAAGALILGLDPGLERTGYALIEVDGRRIVEAGLVRSTRGKELGERLGEISAGVAEILDEHAVRLAAIEELYSHYKHPRTAILMGHARGVLLLAAAERGIETMSLSATRIKKSLTGNGHASKLQVQRAVAGRLGLAKPPEPSDVADAMAVALCAGTMMMDEGRRAARAFGARMLKTAGGS